MWLVWRFFSACDGSEQALTDCGMLRKWVSLSTVEVVCTDVLPRPNITVLLTNGDSDGQEVTVPRGHSFTIVCTVEPWYHGGQFSVIREGRSDRRTLPAVGSAASFEYTQATETSQGTYSCLYHNLAFHHKFTTESHTLSLSITGSEEVMLDNGVDPSGTACNGRVNINQNNQTRLLAAGSPAWDTRHSTVICRQLGCHSADVTKHVHLGRNETMWFFFSDCDGSESKLLDCGHVQSRPSSTTIEVACTGSRRTAEN
ncbi:uncharacterized protein LOC142880781 [Nelusetta ayraudi]|uniref:uncharacterized protein LOC142880781 n=1 Tax=Nelusetta ayraudi TaxID=303726 RepID=UPI003F727B0B